METPKDMLKREERADERGVEKIALTNKFIVC